jgi:hypothetical protein
MTCLLLGGCSENTDKTDAVESAQSHSKETPFKTTGQVVFEGIPDDGVTSREVIVIDALEPEGRERIQRQRQLFEYKTTGRNPELEEAERMAAGNLLPEESREFDRQLVDLRAGFPELLTLDARIKEDGVDDDRIRKLTSDSALHKEYQELFRAIRWENLKRGVEFIEVKIKTDGKEWSEKQYVTDDLGSKKASVTLNWINMLAEHLTAYVTLGNKRIRAVNDLATQSAEISTKILTWEDYVDYFRDQLIIDISKEELASATLEADGTFKVDGQGDLLIRLEYGFRSAYFLVGDSKENRVSVIDLQVLDKEPAPEL